MPRPRQHAVLVTCTTSVLQKIEVAASQVLQDKIVIRCNNHDRLKLYNIWVWSEKYKLPLQVVLSEILSFWLAKIRKKRKRGTLGVRISTLVSKASKNYLLLRLQELYPSNEHLTQWREDQINVLAASQLGDFSCDDISAYVVQYKEYINESRTTIRELSTKYKKPFRNNPFVR